MTLPNLDTFMNEYAKALAEYVATSPAEYSYSPDAVPGVVAKARTAFEEGASGTGSWPNKGPSMTRACKRLGINNTFKALGAYLRGDA